MDEPVVEQVEIAFEGTPEEVLEEIRRRFPEDGSDPYRGGIRDVSRDEDGIPTGTTRRILDAS